MRLCFLWNTKARGHPESAALAAWLARHARWSVRDVDSAEDFAEAVNAAVREGFDRIVIAGGDGTVHAALNAAGTFGKTAFALVPLGTGNDLARTLALPFDPLESLKLAEKGPVHRLDAVLVTGDVNARMINAANGGFAGMVTARLTEERKETWGPLAYLRQAAENIADPPTWTVQASFDGSPAETLTVLNVVVANGRTAAGGVVVAPTADPESGRVDVLLVVESDPLNRAVVTARLLAGDYDRDEAVRRRRVSRFELTSETPMPFSIDGEQCEGTRFQFTVQPSAVPFVTGPGYRKALRSRWSLAGAGSRLLALLGGMFRLLRAAPRSDRLELPLFAITVLLLALLTALRSDYRAFDERVLRAIHRQHSETLTDAAIALARLGDTWGTTIVSVLCVLGLALRKKPLDAAMLALVLIGATGTSRILKGLFAAARPGLFVSPFPAEGFSYPSGHAVAAVALYGTLAALILQQRTSLRRLLAFVLILLAFAIMWCRLYLGVHWPTDVLAGALVGFAWLLAGLLIRRRVTRK